MPLLHETFLPNLQSQLLASTWTSWSPSCIIFHLSPYHHLSQYWHNIYFTYLCVCCLSLSLMVAEVFFFLFNAVLYHLKQEQIFSYQGDRNSWVFSRVYCWWELLFPELIWSWPKSDLHFPLLINKLLLVLGYLSGCWLCTATQNPLLFLLSLVVYLEHAEIST